MRYVGQCRRAAMMWVGCTDSCFSPQLQTMRNIRPAAARDGVPASSYGNAGVASTLVAGSGADTFYVTGIDPVEGHRPRGVVVQRPARAGGHSPPPYRSPSSGDRSTLQAAMRAARSR
jgi:hypothetical protein